MRTRRDSFVIAKSTNSRQHLRCLIGLLLLAFVVSGCEHDYKWQEYKIAANRVSAANTLDASTSVSLRQGESSEEREKLGNIGAHRYYGSCRQLTDAVMIQVTQELSQRNVKVAGDAPKALEISVTDTQFTEGMWMLRAELDVHVKAGNGYVRDIHVSNKTPNTVGRAFDGAVALAAIEILNDSSIADYLKQ